MPPQPSSSNLFGLQNLWMLAFGALMLFGIYRRFRRNFGRQRLRPVAMILRIGLLAVVAVATLPLVLRVPGAFAAAAGGAAIGLAIGGFAAERTRFETHEQQLHYIPHTYAGIAVFALFLGRVIYRWVQLYSSGVLTGTAGQQAAAGGSTQAMVTSPLTLGLLFLLISYNVYYSGRVLWKSRHLRPQDIESASMPS
jgi:hypothetical protein